MKLSKDEVKAKVNELVEDSDKAIELLEIIEDSMDIVPEVDTTELDNMKEKYEDLQKKYKERFLEIKESDIKEEKDDDLQEENIIDIKDI